MFLILWKDEDVGDFPPLLVVLKLETNYISLSNFLFMESDTKIFLLSKCLVHLHAF